MGVRLPDTYDVRPTPGAGRAVAGYDAGGPARALAGIGDTLIEYGEHKQREQDASAVFALRRQLDDWERGAIFDPDKGAINQTGKNAFGIGPRVLKDYDEFAGKLTQGLNERQRRAFQELSTSRRAQVGDWAAKHEAKQRDVHEIGEYQADLSSMRDRAALFPDKAGTETALMAQRIIGFGRAKGMSEEQIKAEITNHASGTHRAVVAALVNGGRLDDAKKYLDANRTGMQAPDLLAAESGMRELLARGKAQAAADDVMARGLTATQALDEVRDKFSGDPHTRDAAVQQVKAMFAERDAIEARNHKQAADEAWKVITNGGSRKQIAPELWARLSGEEQRQINDYGEAKWRRAKADAEGKRKEETAENVRTYVGLRDMAYAEPAKFAELDLARVQPILTDKQFDRIVEIRGAINKKDAKTSTLLAAQKRAEAMVFAEMRTAGIDTTPKEGSKKAEELAMFRSRLIAEIDAQDGPMDDRRLREIGLGLLREGIEQGSGVGGFFQTRRRGFEMEPGKTYVSKRYGEIPSEVRSALEAELPRPRNVYGRPILQPGDEAAIERAYQRGVEAGRFK
jgi:hypothetical protein